MTRRRRLPDLPASPDQPVRSFCLDDLGELPADADQAVAPSEPSLDNLAYVLYTSGSTGRPKGVAVTHRGLASYLLWALDAYPAGAGSGAPVHSPLGFDLTVTSLFLPLLTGRRAVLIPEEQGIEGLALALAEGGFSLVKLTPAHLEVLSRLLPPERAAECAGAFVIGGEPLSGEQLAFWRSHAPNLRLFNEYGPTETVVGCSVWEVPGTALPAGPVPIGRPIAGARIQILDPRLQPVPAGAHGELCIGGAGVCRGYLHRPDLTAEKLVPDPFGRGGERLYRSGDLARFLPDGTIDLLGRMDHQVKIRGFRIELGEIEAVLTAQAAVREAVVVVRDDRSGSRALVAYLAGDVAVDALRRALQERLPDYMLPATFVRLAALPLTPNGKVDRNALPAPDGQSAGTIHAAPRTPTEEIVAGIWAELLGVERVGVDDSFFALGGHSLQGTRVMSRLRSAFGIEVPLRTLFEAPVLADFALRIDTALRAGVASLAPPLVAVPRGGPLPLSFAQQRLWFIDQLEPASPLYNIPVALRVEGPLDGAVLARCLGEIVRRHEALRTVFVAQEGSPVQVIQPAARFALPLVDLSGLPDRERESLAPALVGDEARRPFDLARDPLLRGVLLRLTDSGEKADHIAALTMHHIASDGWSMGILVREVTALYAALAEGRPSSLPELPVQYADFAVWQRSWLQGEVLDEEIAFWRRQLAGLPPLLELPADRPRPVRLSFRGAALPVWLPAGLTRQMEALTRSEGATLFMVLLAGFQALLARTSGQDDLAVGSPVAGRNRLETEGLIGFFVNTLVLRGDLSGPPSPTFRALLGRVRETALAAYMHQDVPFEKLVEELSPQRSLAHAAMFQVMLVLQNAPTESLEVRDLHLRPVGRAGTASKLDLTLSLGESDGGLAGTATYATDLFDATTVARLLARCERLLAAAVADPDRPVTELPLLSVTELHQVRAEWNPPLPVVGGALCAHERFAAQVERTPDAVSLVYQGKSITARDLNRRANQLARALKKRGVGPEVTVAVFLERTPELVLAILGILKAGGAYVPFDTTYPQDRLAYLLQDSGAHLLLTEEHLKPLLPEQTPPLLCLSADWGEISRESDADFTSGAAPDHLAYVLYTSGSTGRPKGVGVSHANLMSYIDAMDAELHVPLHSSYVMISTIAADGGNTVLFLALATGGRLHILSRETSLDPQAVAEYFEQHPIDFFKIVVSHFASLFNTPFGARLMPRKWLILGGEALGWELVDGIRDLHPRCQVFDHYGPTETTVGVLMNRIDLTAGIQP
ncbi:MAG TPA: amino acid adenylation domain-containing protein, partial [Thermoanaerobaculia bacterium]